MKTSPNSGSYGQYQKCGGWMINGVTLKSTFIDPDSPEPQAAAAALFQEVLATQQALLHYLNPNGQLGCDNTQLT